MQQQMTRTTPGGAVLLAGIVALTATTAYIHFTLGGLLFLLNAVGYTGLGVLYVAAELVDAPIVRRFAWLPRVALAGFAATTIAGYLVLGPYFQLGWITKAVEVALIGLIVADIVRVYRSPVGLVRAAVASLT